MSTVELEQQAAADRRRVDAGAGGGRRSSAAIPFTGAPVTVAAAAAAADDARRACDAAAAAFADVGRHGRRAERRALLLDGRRPADGARAARSPATMAEEGGGTFGWGMFNCDLAARHAARGGGADLRA